MTELTIIEQAVLDLIPLSIERKIAIREISSLIDIDERSVYEVINSLRKKGIPICAIRHGEPTNRGTLSLQAKKNVRRVLLHIKRK